MVRNVGDKAFFETLWESAVALRGALQPSEYKHPVLALLFFKYVSDSFGEFRSDAQECIKDENHEFFEMDIDDPDLYEAANIFWVPEVARWEYLVANAKQPNFAKILDDASKAIEDNNPDLKGMLYRGFGLLKIPSSKLGELVDLLGTLSFNNKEHRSADVLGLAYEFFLGKFALAEGSDAGAFFTCESIVKTLVEIIAPTRGVLYEPAIGSGGMVAWSEKFMESHGGERGDISVYGQEYTYTTWKMAAMNLLIRGIDFDLGAENADTLQNDLHKDVRADYILANPPFNQEKWGASKVANDVRWKWGTPTDSNANYAWIQHMLYHLNDTGRAGVVMANGAMTSTANTEGDIRKAIIEDDLVECMVALPPKLFINTQIPSCLFIFNKNKKRKGETLFIDARHLGRLESRAQLVFDQHHVDEIAQTYHAWAKTDFSVKEYEDIPGFCKSAKLEDIQKAGFVLSPGRYVGAAEVEEDEASYQEDMAILTEQLSEQITKSVTLDEQIKASLAEVGYDI
nr:class I SAM-dependent DNA methyltransferase [Vibrio sp. 10N.286.48.B7]PMH78510.1 restriction endonuclease subunit M [Vibrio sp. 10N.286.48.B7]